MNQVQLDDRLYAQAQRRALEAGYRSVDEFVADAVTHELEDDAQDLQRLFTPERIASIKEAAAEVEAGEYLTAEQVREHFKKRFES